MFEFYPTIAYNPNYKVNNESVQAVTNIFFRTRFQEVVKNENVSYYLYTIRDQDTPESIAYKYYGDARRHWIILLANDIVNPYYDWPLSLANFNNYIRDKYGSLASAQTTIHHYEKVITTTDSKTGEVTERRYWIDETDARDTEGESLPHDAYDELAVDSYPNLSGTFKDGSGVTMVISRDAISQYDWELEENEKKRNIKLIRKEYYDFIEEQLRNLVSPRTPYSREIRGY